ncbi:hypothetical protein IWZ00DRAFT_260529 [Phyllosticta capitalensis]|uniref:HIT-type domain-containing protein n=1 Tax=Phyllosticta capitalensis TaxID=121624 RepID=A0ABR1YV48_9PEZI
MADEPLLSDLCRICNKNPPKYRCPRDDVRTCSLPCVQRHRQWAQCDGKRDPAAYVKKSQLLTPAGVDRDYNFLTSLERSLQRADENAQRAGPDHRPRTPQKLQHYLHENRIVVDRAPVGMSRQTSNKTRTGKGHRVIWTVEWLHHDGSRELCDTNADDRIADSYRARAKSQSKKRKLSEHDNLPSPPVKAAKPNSDSANHVGDLSANHAADDARQAITSAEGPEPRQHQIEPVKPSACSFYLLKPYIPASQPRVLIPLSPESTLTEALRDQVVIEFPTIKLLPHPQGDAPLPEGFILEDEFYRQSKKDALELDELLGPNGQIMSEAKVGRPDGEQRENTEDDLDNKKLLEALKQDFGARS